MTRVKCKDGTCRFFDSRGECVAAIISIEVFTIPRVSTYSICKTWEQWNAAEEYKAVDPDND